MVLSPMTSVRPTGSTFHTTSVTVRYSPSRPKASWLGSVQTSKYYTRARMRFCRASATVRVAPCSAVRARFRARSASASLIRRGS